MPRELDVDCNGLALVALPERALWWPAHRTLLIADPHFGKAATFRVLGQPVPAGTTARNLARLDGLLSRWPARHLIILGDFLHSRHAHSKPMLAALQAWRERYPDLACTLVRGNHDDHAGDPPASLGFAIVDEPWIFHDMACWHRPPSDTSPIERTRYAVCGHIHPVIVLRGRGRDRARLPCFDLGPAVGVLPAFGAFTGGWEVSAAPRHLRVVIADDDVFALYPSQSAQQFGVS